ncbi:hypothetical protein [Ruania halotolerans]|uniref:hypothetical protein n=1 Tax=Ruania halotolerans TaxID=2897773 RepID=UPI001E4B92D3|nr:hypothetical protein [Ruania halotolerans]UFU07694.1 hypothetical protein LQF10_06235 [Ruania halotolerans]
MSAPPPSGQAPYGQPVHGGPPDLSGDPPGHGRPGPDLANPNVGGVVLLLVLASFGYLVWHVIQWTEPFIEALDGCARTGESEVACLTGTDARRWVYLPIAAVITAWSLAAGARVEGKQGRQRGFLLALAGFVVLGISAWVSAS